MIMDRRQLIDFGLAEPVSEVKAGVCVQTTWYRAPEVILRSLYNKVISIWTLGLTAAELALGFPLYPGETEYKVLRFIMETQGQPADYLLDRGTYTDDYFYRQENGQQRWRFKTPEEFTYDTRCNAGQTKHILLNSFGHIEVVMVMVSGRQSDERLFIDLVKKMLKLDADHRIKPLEVLQHPFFNNSDPQSPHPDSIQIGETVPEVIREKILNSAGSQASLHRQKLSVEHWQKIIPNRLQPEQDGWFRRLYRRITEAFYNLFQ
ncbi:hypothetical protein PAMP_014784 [Pampus punctatissimus]